MGVQVYRETTGKVHEVEFYPDAEGWNITVGDYIRKCEHNRIPAMIYRKCFICGRHLSMHKPPLVIYVSGIGLRFSCTACYEWHGGNSSEETEL